MARYLIPLDSTDAAFSCDVDLDAARYRLQFTWNTRGRFWSLDVLERSGASIVSGIRVVANWPLLHAFQDPRLPGGILFTVDMSEVGADPGERDLGDRLVLVYDDRR